MTPSDIKKSKGDFPVLNDFFDTDRFFNSPFFDNGFNSLMPTFRGRKMPSVNVTETDKAYMLDVAAPGLKRDDFKVEFADGVLSISAEKEETQEEKGKEFTRKEFSYNSFYRSFTMPDDILSDKIEARYEDGILKIEVPKKEMTISKPKKTISVG